MESLKKIKCATMVCIMLLLTNCTVYTNIRYSGLNMQKILKCTNKECLTKNGMALLASDCSKYNEKICSEFENQNIAIYGGYARKSDLRYLRSLGHIALDVATYGIWELYGTRLEAFMACPYYVYAIVDLSNKKDISFKIEKESSL